VGPRNKLDKCARGRQVREPVTRRERNEENWVRPIKKLRFPLPVRTEAEERAKVGPPKISAPAGDQPIHGGVAGYSKEGMSKSGSSRKSQRASSLIAELEGLA
jgi:hypothetical protein